jgi:SAM-dependent methyltransferase
MSLYEWLEQPRIYNWKSRILSLGRPSVRDYLRREVSLSPEDRVLDVGCGTGRHANSVGGTYYGVDMDSAYLAYARGHGRGAFAQMDAGILAFAEGGFDFVLAVGLTHHLEDEQVRKVAREIVRVLKPGGSAMIIDAVLPSPLHVTGYVLFRLDRGAHTRSRAALAALLQDAAFELKTANIPGSFPYCRAAFAYRKPE